MSGLPTAADRRLARSLLRWFAAHARPLPWRTTPRNPYLTLISEFMLQQTQVARVLEKWPTFLARFPSLPHLALADESHVLAAWSGMGFYRRARNLHAAARAILERFNGAVPSETRLLRSLPGIGPYTAGAIASIAFNRPEPIVDGNVARVLLRLNGKKLRPARARPWAWKRAATLVAASHEPGLFNEALMELGATLCTPRLPRCPRCPLRSACRAYAASLQNKIPLPRPAPRRETLWCASVVVRDSRGRVLLERRPLRGMFAGLWQTPTLEAPAPPTAPQITARLGLRHIQRRAAFDHALSHRLLKFEVYEARRGSAPLQGSWCEPARLAELPLSNAQRRVIALVLDHPITPLNPRPNPRLQPRPSRPHPTLR